MKLIINDVPPSNNKFIGRSYNPFKYQKEKKYWQELIYFSSIEQGLERKKIKKSIVFIKYFFKTKIRHDPDNYSGKFLLDGLVKAEIIEDDSFDNIKLFLDSEQDKKEPRTEIEVIEVENFEFIEKFKNMLKGENYVL